ncbi:hypothetical protein O181_010446 [Austropuccinia psidii MF-1]|uniref:Uncharacterized protein n=1 Tax=Austropuccinia psidii MF-1 TaxID=1389203 RepID=A0A9Q3BR22_9BASI|nr:hypothetical protein [Austropuccinia psidii MF-1]
MTPTRSGSNYSIQSNGSGPGHSNHNSKRQEFQPRGEAQMEDSRTSTSSQRLSSTFDTLIESVTTTKNDPPHLVLWQSQPENQVGANWPHHIFYGQLGPSGVLWPFGHSTFPLAIYGPNHH